MTGTYGTTIFLEAGAGADISKKLKDEPWFGLFWFTEVEKVLGYCCSIIEGTDVL